MEQGVVTRCRLADGEEVETLPQDPKTLHDPALDQVSKREFWMYSQKLGRTYPGTVASRMSVFIVPNAVSGLSRMPAEKAATIPCLKPVRGCAASTDSRWCAESSSKCNPSTSYSTPSVTSRTSGCL